MQSRWHRKEMIRRRKFRDASQGFAGFVLHAPRWIAERRANDRRGARPRATAPRARRFHANEFVAVVQRSFEDLRVDEARVAAENRPREMPAHGFIGFGLEGLAERTRERATDRGALERIELRGGVGSHDGVAVGARDDDRVVGNRLRRELRTGDDDARDGIDCRIADRGVGIVSGERAQHVERIEIDEETEPVRAHGAQRGRCTRPCEPSAQERSPGGVFGPADGQSRPNRNRRRFVELRTELRLERPREFGALDVAVRVRSHLLPTGC